MKGPAFGGADYFLLWLACYTQEEIAEVVNISKMEVSRVSNEMADLPESCKAAAGHLIDFTPPVYNVVTIPPLLSISYAYIGMPGGYFLSFYLYCTRNSPYQ